MATTIERPAITSVATFTVDGEPIGFEPGETILEAMRRHGHRHHVPSLCYDPQLVPFGACRVCLVGIEGQNKPVASCHTPVREGMAVYTRGEKIERLRRNVVELLLSDLPAGAGQAAHFGRNEFHSVVKQTHADGTKFRTDLRKEATLPHWENGMVAGFRTEHPYLGLDLSQCIVCSRCVRACDEIQGTFALTIQGRGNASVAVPGAGMSFSESDCVSCGACANTCPTGAIFDKGFLEAQTNHAEREAVTTCSYCGVGCSLVVQLKDDKVFAIKPNPHGPSNEGHLCLKGRFAFRFATSPDRLTTPLVRNSATGELEPATWEEAIGLIARRFGEIRVQHGHEALAGISSARGSNEENFLFQKFYRQVIGTNNVDSCNRT